MTTCSVVYVHVFGKDVNVLPIEQGHLVQLQWQVNLLWTVVPSGVGKCIVPFFAVTLEETPRIGVRVCARTDVSCAMFKYTWPCPMHSGGPMRRSSRCVRVSCMVCKCE